MYVVQIWRRFNTYRVPNTSRKYYVRGSSMTTVQHLTVYQNTSKYNSSGGGRGLQPTNSVHQGVVALLMFFFSFLQCARLDGCAHLARWKRDKDGEHAGKAQLGGQAQNVLQVWALTLLWLQAWAHSVPNFLVCRICRRTRKCRFCRRSVLSGRGHICCMTV